MLLAEVSHGRCFWLTLLREAATWWCMRGLLQWKLRTLELLASASSESFVVELLASGFRWSFAQCSFVRVLFHLFLIPRSCRRVVPARVFFC